MSDPVLEHTASMTPKADREPVRVRVKKPRGTLYWGGAGLDGPYIKPQLQAFRDAGMQHVWVGLTNTATKTKLGPVGTIVDAIRAGLLIRYEDDDAWTITNGMDQPAEQFNLIGYSYGSLLAAQTANYYSKQGHIVDHLVLIGSPIDKEFLYKLRAYRHIKKVVVIDLTAKGDPIYAGMPLTDLMEAVPQLGKDMGAGKGEGHFYYAHVVTSSKQRWAELAKKLYDAGLR